MKKVMGKGANSTVKSCTCNNTVQDKLYGKGMRVHTVKRGNGAKGTGGGLVCTVCGKVK